jgi:SsrA-binding protein
MPRETGRKVVASNRKARHDYLIEDTYEMGRASLIDGFAQLTDGELWLEGVHIPEYTQGTWTNHAVRRKRKLLLHRSEIAKIAGELQGQGLTIVPLQLYFKDGKAKVEIALAKGKKQYDKRHALRERQDRRETDRAISTRQNR